MPLASKTLESFQRGIGRCGKDFEGTGNTNNARKRNEKSLMKKLLLTVLAMGLVATAQAQILLSWDVQGTGTLNNTGYLQNSTATGITSTTGLGRTTVAWSSAGNSFSSNTWNLTNTFNEATNYINFSFTVDSGYAGTITSLSYAMNGSNTAPATQVWGYRINSGAFVLSSDLPITNPAVSSLATWDFSDAGITAGDTVEFRFWAYGTTSINGGTSAVGGTTRIANITGNDLVLNGSVSLIPEPSTYALLGLGFAALVALRRRAIKQA